MTYTGNISLYKLFGITCMMVLSITATAQKYDLGIAGVYGDDIQSFGQNTRFYINSSDHRFCFGPEFSWFLEEKEIEGDLEKVKNLIEFNFNGHMNFDITHQLGFYPLVGMNFSREREREFEFGALEHDEFINKLGLNVGSGLHLKLSNHWIMYAEYDHLFSELNQNTFTIGILKGFGEFAKATEHGE